jgi:hypothetical protein
MITMSVDDKTVRPSGLAGRVRGSPYYPALSHPVVRRLLPGVSTSALGDGMSAVAIAWLALNLAPPASRGLWVGAAVAAYTLPGALGAVLFGRWLRRSSGSRIAAIDAALRAAVLGLTGCLALAGALGPAGFVALLGVSSLFSAWGVAGRYTLIAELLSTEHRIAGNTIFGLTDQVAITIGPALAGLIAAAAGPAVVIVIDAVTWAVLAVSYQRVVPLARPARSPEVSGPDQPDRAGAWALIRSAPVLPGLLALSFLFYLLYGPVEVALPVHVAADLHGSAALLGMFWAIFGVGAIVGELAAPYLRRLPTWPTMTAIVLGWGVALLPLGLSTPLWLGPAAFCAGAVIWGPWTSLSMAVFQEAALPGVLAPVLAARSALLTIATPLGTALGGPMIAALGARGTLLVSALTTIMLGLIATAVLIYRRRRSLLVPVTQPVDRHVLSGARFRGDGL